MDLLYIVLFVLFLVLALALVKGCEVLENRE